MAEKSIFPFEITRKSEEIKTQLSKKSPKCEHPNGCIHELLCNTGRSFAFGFLFNVAWALVSYLRSKKKTFLVHLLRLKDIKLPVFLTILTFILRSMSCGLKNLGVVNPKIISLISGCNITT